MDRTERPNQGALSARAKIDRGLIPWNAGGYWAAVKWLQQVHTFPTDQWPHPEGGLVVAGSTEAFPEESLDPGSLDVQLWQYLLGQYTDAAEAEAHYVRYHRIGAFLEAHRDRLIEDGLICDVDEEGANVRSVLLHALCVLPYSRRQPNRESGEEEWVCAYTAAAVKARLLAAEGWP